MKNIIIIIITLIFINNTYSQGFRDMNSFKKKGSMSFAGSFGKWKNFDSYKFTIGRYIKDNYNIYTSLGLEKWNFKEDIKIDITDLKIGNTYNIFTQRMISGRNGDILKIGLLFDAGASFNFLWKQTNINILDENFYLGIFYGAKLDFVFAKETLALGIGYRNTRILLNNSSYGDMRNEVYLSLIYFFKK